jgi:ankyrin repeat protein
VGLLLKKGREDLEALNEKGETALFRAVSEGEKGIVQLLLENGANHNVREGSDRNSALYEAVYHNRKSILKLLLDKSGAAIEEISFTMMCLMNPPP